MGGVVLSALLAPGTRILTPLFDPSDGGGGRFLAWPGYTLIGVLLYLLPTLVLLELPQALALRTWRRAEQQTDATPVPAASAPAAEPGAPEPTAPAPAEAGGRLVGRRLFLGRAVGTAPWPGPPPWAPWATACPRRSGIR
ncbi:hypothetical protein [Streptomyces sp. H27-H1]|uniref:hypothetical protein n=1 Tax=Streptomyces sp. H27-H1 TaxID=2996461 RepID=UPI002D1E40FD|nr:hypothetical protein [Streptomyces sp. H27-H1]